MGCIPMLLWMHHQLKHQQLPQHSVSCNDRGSYCSSYSRNTGSNILTHTPFIVGGGFVLGAIILIFLNRDYAVKPVEMVEEKPETTTLKVKDFMVPDVISIKPDATVKELLNLLTQHHISGVPVVDNQNKIVGMASDGDIIRYLNPKEGSVHDFIYDIFIEEGETEQEVLKEKNKYKGG